MVRRHGRRSVDPDAPVVDLDRVLADDVAIDGIGRRPLPDADPAGVERSPGAHRAADRHHRPPAQEPLFELLDDWRLELAGRPMPEFVAGAPPDRSRPIQPGDRRRSWRAMMAVAAAIGAVLVGTATVGAANADPYSPLWPITQFIWPARAQSFESTRQVQIAVEEAREALRAGRSQDARSAIARAEAELDNIDDAAARDSMRDTVNQLLVKSEPSLASWLAQGAAEPSAATVVSGTAGSVPGSTQEPGQVSADAVDSTAADSAGSVNPALLVPAGESGSSADVAPGGSTSAAITSSAAPDSAGSATSTPAPPATVPDPAAVVEPSPPASATPSSSPPVATQQSAPSPTQTTESSGDTATTSVSGTDGGGAQSPAAADESSTSSTTGTADPG